MGGEDRRSVAEVRPVLVVEEGRRGFQWGQGMGCCVWVSIHDVLTNQTAIHVVMSCLPIIFNSLYDRARLPKP